MKLKQKMGKLLLIKLLVNNLKPMLFIVGFVLTLWRANECVKKYLNNNLSTKVSLVKSFQTVQPNFVICPSYLDAYNSVALTNVGIPSVAVYRNGNWTGNSTKNGKSIFKDVTHKLENLLDGFIVQFKTGRKMETFRDLNITEHGHRTYGKCYEISFSNYFENVFFVDVVPKMSVYVYLNLPHQFWNLDSRSKVQVNLEETLFLDVSYDLLKSNHDENCKNYGNSQVNDEMIV